MVESPHIAYYYRDRPAELAATKVVIGFTLIPPLVDGVVDDLSVLNGVLGSDPQVLDAERSKTYTEAYNRVFGESIEGFQVFHMSSTYDFAALAMFAIEQAGTDTDGDAIRLALASVGDDSNEVVVTPTNLAAGLAAIREGKTINYDGATGDTDFSSGTAYPSPVPILCYEVVDGPTFDTRACPE